MGKRYDTMVSYKTLVLGASANQKRYAYKAVVLLLKNKIEVIPMGIKPGIIDGLLIVKPFIFQKGIHTISIYLSPALQVEYFEFIINLKPQRVIFNPGTENPEFTKKLNEVKIPFENSCSLVLLSSNQYKS